MLMLWPVQYAALHVCGWMIVGTTDDSVVGVPHIESRYLAGRVEHMSILIL